MGIKWIGKKKKKSTPTGTHSTGAKIIKTALEKIVSIWKRIKTDGRGTHSSGLKGPPKR